MKSKGRPASHEFEWPDLDMTHQDNYSANHANGQQAHVPFKTNTDGSVLKKISAKYMFLFCLCREEVQDHRVKWSAKFQFSCKMTASATSGVLEACMVRVSVRKVS